MASPIDDALRRTADAVARYGSPEQMIGAAAKSLAGKPCQVRAEMEANALHDAILRHRRPARRPAPD
ncbi:hypothetical protein ODJ79_03620 [Actinoplanes sp. KI2]|uniref:hypothetical protein n=1 Tax=Actinoplanes sp. KI2 TaxID=2983315 RepID=UPI0021D58404|nr:hypothetical protein [Actinoplanes sp. KI2]MCU7722793.1 hypothetical protein [Actinoplanes sp. KI2]